MFNIIRPIRRVKIIEFKFKRSVKQIKLNISHSNKNYPC